MKNVLKKIFRPLYLAVPLPKAYKLAIRKKINDIVNYPKRKLADLKKVHLPSFACAQKNNLPDIFIFSVIDWSFRVQRPQHIAKAFAQKGHRVFYISNNFIDSANPKLKVEPLSDHLPLYRVQLGLIYAPQIYSAALSFSGLRQLSEELSACLSWTQSEHCIAIVQHPFWNELAFGLPDSWVIYDCMDHHAGFNETAALTLTKEKELLKKAHLVLTSSQKLYDEAIISNPSVALVRNATDYNYFSKRPAEIYKDSQNRKIIGYYGAIAEWFDENIIESVAKAFPEYLILLIGNDTAGIQKKLGHHKNIIFTGEVPYEKLTYYLYAFDVCIISFKINALTLATNPVKIYEYLSAGKPVVSVNLPELQSMSHLVNLANSPEEFIEQIKTVSENDSQRQKFASQQAWAMRAEEIEQALKQIKEPLVSIIVLTYNNLHLTKACLESIDQYTDYENYEVIVVDNLSTDDTPSYLKENYMNKKHYKVILNDANSGFSAGNNIGLKAATGDYLVILNNDTRVTPGWLRTMINHFRLHPDMGLLGPSTNNIGNEAKIEVSYSNPDKMFPEVRNIVFSEMGKIEPLRTAAFFCVMLPREVFEKVGFLDEKFGLGFFEDDDYCRRVETVGYKIYCARDVFVHHHLSASFNKMKSSAREALFEKNKQYYESKWGKWVPHGTE